MIIHRILITNFQFQPRETQLHIGKLKFNLTPLDYI